MGREGAALKTVGGSDNHGTHSSWRLAPDADRCGGRAGVPAVVPGAPSGTAANLPPTPGKLLVVAAAARSGVGSRSFPTA